MRSCSRLSLRGKIKVKYKRLGVLSLCRPLADSNHTSAHSCFEWSSFGFHSPVTSLSFSTGHTGQQLRQAGNDGVRDPEDPLCQSWRGGHRISGV